MSSLDWRQAAGFGLLILGGILIALGWYGVSGTTNTAQQLAYFISGGLGGASLIAVGVALLISFEHVADRQTLQRLNARIDTLEFRLAAEFDAFRDDLRNERTASTTTAARRAR